MAMLGLLQICYREARETSCLSAFREIKGMSSMGDSGKGLVMIIILSKAKNHRGIDKPTEPKRQRGLGGRGLCLSVSSGGGWW